MNSIERYRRRIEALDKELSMVGGDIYKGMMVRELIHVYRALVDIEERLSKQENTSYKNPHTLYRS